MNRYGDLELLPGDIQDDTRTINEAEEFHKLIWQRRHSLRLGHHKNQRVVSALLNSIQDTPYEDCHRWMVVDAVDDDIN